MGDGLRLPPTISGIWVCGAAGDGGPPSSPLQPSQHYCLASWHLCLTYGTVENKLGIQTGLLSKPTQPYGTPNDTGETDSALSHQHTVAHAKQLQRVKTPSNNSTLHHGVVRLNQAS